MSKHSKLFYEIGIILILLFLAIPIIVVVVASFGPDRSMSFPPSTISLKWYDALFSEREWLIALIQSLQISLLSTLFSCVFGLLGSVAIYDMQPGLRLSRLS